MADFDVAYEEKDSGGVATVLHGWTPELDPSSFNWRGVGDPNRRLDPPAQPGEDPERPTVVLGFRIEYTDVVSTFDDDDDDPIRTGFIVFRVSIDIGAGQGAANSLFRQLRKLFKLNGDSTGLVIFPEIAKPVSLGVRGDWWCDELRMPFTGGCSAGGS